MKKLMISLDKKILDINSSVARRMVEYGKDNQLFIIVPSAQRIEKELSTNVKVFGTGGKKIQQFFRIKDLGIHLIKKENIEMITTQDPFFTGLAGVMIKKKTGIKLEVQMHGDFFSRDYYKNSGLKNLASYYICNWFVLRFADKIRVVGERIKDSLMDIDVPVDKIEVRPIKIDKEKIENHMPKFDLHDKYPGKKIFLSIGRLEPVKNISFLLEVFHEVAKEKDNLVLLIVGDGSEKYSLKKRSKELGLESTVKFEEWTDDSLTYIKTADCVLFPSLSEGYGLVPMEANIAGTKVIMNDVGVANYELPKSDMVKILPVNDKDKFVNEIKNYE